MKKYIAFYVYLVIYYIYIIGGYPYINSVLKELYSNMNHLSGEDYLLKIALLRYLFIFLTYLATGFTLCCLVKLKKEKRIFVYLDLLMIDIPFLYLASCYLQFIFLPGIPLVIRYNSEFFTIIGSLLLSGEIVRCFKGRTL